MRKRFPNRLLKGSHPILLPVGEGTTSRPSNKGMPLTDFHSRPLGETHAQAAVRVFFRWSPKLIIANAIVLLAVSADGQLFGKPKTGLQPMRSAVDLIKKQAPLRVDQALLARISADDVRIIVSLGKQRAYLMTGGQVVVDSPISSGKSGHTSPSGSMRVLEKDPNHHSSLYGDFVDNSGRIVRAGVSMHIDSAPSGTHFQGAEMKWFMRLTDEGVGMHVGILPGYPASHGCIRMPSDGAKLFYDHVKVGTPVEVQPAA
jgi:lipoprotein-anchoring transpeptidase ErfK/SrfK